MIEDSNDINKAFNYLREEQDALAVKNGVPNLDESEILYSNASCRIMSVTWDTMAQINRKMLWDIFSRL